MVFMNKQKLKNRILFSRRESHLEQRVNEDFIDNGVAAIPCRVSGYDDLISSYSVKGYETLNPEFEAYVEDAASYIPAEYPVLLNITGCRFTEEEQASIRDTIRADFLYELGAVEKKNRSHRNFILAMFIGMLLSGILVFGSLGLRETSVEILYLLFWFCADFFMSYVFLDAREAREDRIRAGRLASAQIVFTEQFEDTALSDEIVQKIYDGILSEENEEEL